MSILYLPETPAGRLAFVAETLGVPAPKGLNANLTDPDGTHVKSVVAFCAETGASLDFIYRGDIRPMLRSAAA